MSAAGAVAVASIMAVEIWVLGSVMPVIYRQVCVKRLYLAALAEAFEDERVGLIHARTKTPSLREFRR